MANPMTIGTTPVKLVSANKNRALVRFQNVCKNVIYLKKIPMSGVIPPVSDTDFEIRLESSPSANEYGEVFETNSIAGFVAVASKADSSVSVYETSYVR